MSTGAGSHHINFYSTWGAVTACSHKITFSKTCQRRPASASRGEQAGAGAGSPHAPPHPRLAPTKSSQQEAPPQPLQSLSPELWAPGSPSPSGQTSCSDFLPVSSNSTLRMLSAVPVGAGKCSLATVTWAGEGEDRVQPRDPVGPEGPERLRKARPPVQDPRAQDHPLPAGFPEG